MNRCRPICVEVNLQIDLLDRWYAECRPILLSTKALLQSVQTASCNPEQDERQSIKETNQVSQSRFTYDRMVEAGWCRKQATHLSSYTVIGAYYLAALPRKYIGARHEKCTPKVCIAYNVDKKLYATAHTSEDCRCQSYEPEISKVIVRTVKKGGIPLISMSLTPEGDPRLSVLDASPVHRNLSCVDRRTWQFLSKAATAVPVTA